MTLSPQIKKEKIRFILIIVALTVLASLIVYFLVRAISNEGEMHKSEVAKMNEKLKALSQNLGSLQVDYKRLNRDRDSLKNHVDYLWPQRSLVYNAKLRDQVGVDIEFKPGDVVVMKSDSSKVVIIEIKVGGNDLSYYINYLVKTKKGESIEISPYEVSPLK